MKPVLTFLVVVSLLYAGICILVFFLQDKLLFFPRPSDQHAVSQLAHRQVSIESSDAVLSGWLIPSRDPENSPLVFYFGGNAEDVSLTALDAGNRADANFVLMNYRGYGNSEGAPSEAKLFTDALAVYDGLIKDTPHNGKVVAFGRSLGSGVSVFLASRRKIDAVVLATPYDSITSVAQRHYPWLPVSLLIRHSFDSLALAPDLDVEALFLAAEHDSVIPWSHARNLADSWGGRSRWILIDNATHNSIGEEKVYWQSIRELLR